LWNVATFGGHPDIVIGLCGTCAMTLIVLAAFTHGLTRPGGRQLIAMTATGGVAVLSVAGAVLVATALVLAALVLTVVAVLLLVLIVEAGTSSRRN
jgi:hypothetical protein